MASNILRGHIGQLLFLARHLNSRANLFYWIFKMFGIRSKFKLMQGKHIQCRMQSPHHLHSSHLHQNHGLHCCIHRHSNHHQRTKMYKDQMDHLLLNYQNLLNWGPNIHNPNTTSHWHQVHSSHLHPKNCLQCYIHHRTYHLQPSCLGNQSDLI